MINSSHCKILLRYRLLGLDKTRLPSHRFFPSDELALVHERWNQACSVKVVFFHFFFIWSKVKLRRVISQKIERGQYFCHLIDRTMVNGQNKIFACGTKQAMLIEVVSFRPILASPGVTFLKDIYIAGLLNSWLLWTIIRRILYSWFLMYSTLSPGQLCFCFRRLDEAFK